MFAASLPLPAYFEAANELPVAPRLFASLIAMLQDANSGMEDVADLIRRDPVLSSRILRVANSAAVLGGGAEPVVDLCVALQRVGFSEAYRLTGFVASQQLANSRLGYYGYEAAKLRETVLFEALAAEAIDRVAGGDGRVAYTAGLFLNLGRSVLDIVAGRHVPDIVAFPDSEYEFIESWEREYFGINGAEMSSDVLLEWNFPAEIADAVLLAGQSKSARLQCPSATVLHLAAAVAVSEGRGLTGEEGLWSVSPDALAEANITEGQFESAGEAARKAFAKWEGNLG